MSSRTSMDETEAEGLLGKRILKLRTKDNRLWSWLKLYLVVSSVFLNVLTAVGVIYLLASGAYTGCTRRTGSYEHGFRTDLDAASEAIGLIEYEFGGGVELDHHGNFVTDQRGAQYVGKPTREIEDAWTILLNGLNVDLTHEQTTNADSWQWPDDGTYFSGLEVFHSLHCLNRIRQAFYPEVYQGLFDEPGDPPRQHHIDHCINHLRQAIQCHSDLTPMQWMRDGDRVILNTATRHTCRDFNRVREWAAARQTNFTAHSSVLDDGVLHIVD